MTIQKIIDKALLPVGCTLYIWGGGWNTADTGAGEDGRRIGVNPQWKAFFETQNSTYDWKKYRYAWGKGLDCSGYIGWVLYNVFEQEGSCKNYVTKAGETGPFLESKGLGTVKMAEQVIDYKPGDIMYSGKEEHVFFVLKQCSDKSLVLLHSSPPGVQMAATVDWRGQEDSKAARIVYEYMSHNALAWYRKFGVQIKPRSYLTEYHQFRWKNLN